MLKIVSTFALFMLFTLLSHAELTSTYDLSAGWRRDHLHWKNSHLKSSYVKGRARSSQTFKDIESYTISGSAKWQDNEYDCYYFRFSADYGFVQKGNVRENFKLRSSWLSKDKVIAHTHTPIKDHSDLYDFNGAAGYPFTFCDNALMIVPLVGFSYHRQRLVAKPHHSYSSYELYDGGGTSASKTVIPKNLTAHRGVDKRRECPCKAKGKEKGKGKKSLYAESSKRGNKREGCKKGIKGQKRGSGSYSDYLLSYSSFYLESSNPLVYDFVSNPWAYSSWSNEAIASRLGLSAKSDKCSYRFSWYGFYLGADIAYALDCDWNLYAELEAHCFDNCHRKRKSWTGVQFVDHSHTEKKAYGFDGVVGLTYTIDPSWYFTANTDFKYWDSNSKHNKLSWREVAINAGIGILF